MHLSPEIEELFHTLADLDREQRLRYFRAHPTDPETRRNVEALLEGDEAAGRLGDLVNAQAAIALEAMEDSTVGEFCGPYRLLSRIGRGGMGEVWRAERIDGFLKRPVALKLPYTGALGSHFAERLHREKDILAGLNHPGIARLYDAGIVDGRPYLALEFVEGVDLASYCDQHRLAVPERLRLFLQVLGAVQHAHSRLVIHRDLKPSNILVTAAGEIKLLDFGIAKLLREGEPAETELTRLGGRAFSLPHASPEQIAGEPVTTASDVFSLGVVLFELLSGEHPFLPAGLPASLGRGFVSDDPKRLSQSAAGAAQALARSTTPSRLRKMLRGDLDHIVRKAIEKRPECRYPTADALRADIERHLAGAPVEAQPESRLCRMGKFAVRHKLGMTAAAAVVLALAAGLSFALWQAHVAREEARTARAVQEFTEQIFHANSKENTDPVKAQQTSARELLDIGARQVVGALKDAPAAKLRMLQILAGLYLDLGLDDQAVDLDKQRLTIARSFYGAKSASLVPELIALGMAMHASRSVNEGEAVLLEAKSLLDAAGDRSSPLRARLLHALAQQYASTDIPKSLEYAKQSVEIGRRYPPSDDLAGSLYIEALSYFNTGQDAKAGKAVAEAIALSKKLNGDPNADLPRYYAYQAQAEENLMHYAAAEKSYRAAFHYAQILGGDADIDTIETESRLGSFFAYASHPREALPYLEHALNACLRTRGPGDPFYTPQMWLQYGMALVINGRPEDALGMISQAVENRRRNRPSTRYLAQMIEDQAFVEIELGRYDRAAQLLEEASRIRKLVGAPLERSYQTPRIFLSLALAKADEAAALVDRFYGNIPESAALSLDLLRKLDYRTQIALLRGDGAAAVALAGRAADAIAASPEHTYLEGKHAAAMFEKGRGYLLEKDPASALPLLERAVQTDAAILDAHAPALALAQAVLGTCYLDLGEPKKAESLLSQAQAILRMHKELGETYRKPARELARRLRGSV